MSANKYILKKWHLVLFIIIAGCFVVLKAFDWFYWPKGTVKIGEKNLSVLIADTPSHRLKGWSDRSSMGAVQGMWFKYNAKSYHTMVMRDMLFSLDIVWISDGEIVDIAPSLQPEPGLTEAQLTKYRPRLPATDVLELPANFALENGLKIGDKIELIRY